MFGVYVMEYKKMREYTHEEFVNLILSLNEEQVKELSARYGGYPVLFRMALDDRISHIPFIQTGAAIIIRNENGQSNIQGLYPCGEGAGYAGGITSAAMDGVKIAEYIVSSYHV